MQKLILITVALISLIYKPLIAMDDPNGRKFLNGQVLHLLEQANALSKIMLAPNQYQQVKELIAQTQEIHRILRILIEGGCHRNGGEWKAEKISAQDLKEIKKNANQILIDANKEIANAGLNLFAAERCRRVVDNFDQSLNEIKRYRIVDSKLERKSEAKKNHSLTDSRKKY